MQLALRSPEAEILAKPYTKTHAENPDRWSARLLVFGMLLAYIGAETLVVGGWVWGWLRLAGALTGLPWQRLAHALIPFAGTSVFVGLSLLTSSQLAAEGILLPWANGARLVLLSLAALWAASLAWRLAKRNRAAAASGILIAAGLPLAAWSIQYFVW